MDLSDVERIGFHGKQLKPKDLPERTPWIQKFFKNTSTIHFRLTLFLEQRTQYFLKSTRPGQETIKSAGRAVP